MQSVSLGMDACRFLKAGLKIERKEKEIPNQVKAF